MTIPEIPAREMDYSRSEMDSLIKWRQEKVWELKSCGLTIDEIVESLKPKQGIKISHATVHRDLKTKEKKSNPLQGLYRKGASGTAQSRANQP